MDTFTNTAYGAIPHFFLELSCCTWMFIVDMLNKPNYNIKLKRSISVTKHFKSLTILTKRAIYSRHNNKCEKFSKLPHK